MIKLYYSFEKEQSDTFIKKALGKYFNTDEEFFIKRTENGKPYVERENTFFSLSHTDGIIVCAVSDSEVGVDVERKRKVKSKEKILKKFLGQEACRFTQFASGQNQKPTMSLAMKTRKFLCGKKEACQKEISDIEFIKKWTAFESRLKYLGGTIAKSAEVKKCKENVFTFEFEDYIISVCPEYFNTAKAEMELI